MKYIALLFLTALTTYAIAASDQLRSARANKDTDLLSGPGLKNTKIASIPSEAKVSAGSREGAWIKVNYGKSSGWTYVMNISFTEKLEAEDSYKKTLAILGREGDSKFVSSTGTRGLSEDDLRRATPNRDEMDKLMTFASSKDEADEFAKEESLSDLSLKQGK